MKILIALIQFLYLFSLIQCASDTITFQKRGCLYLDQINTNSIIIEFIYKEGYYRAIHASYTYTKSKAVTLKYLGDSSKNVYLNCVISPNYITTIGSLYQYYIPCTFEKINEVNEGTYCVEITGNLIGDIKGISFCDNSNTFKIIRTTNLPTLSISGFASEQIGCIQIGSEITLLGQVKNKITEYQYYGNIGIGLSNTELVSKNIPLECSIQGGVSINSYAKIICKIPYDISKSTYTVLFSDDLKEGYQCPANVINSFNSLNFKNNPKKLQISDGISDLEAKLIKFYFGKTLGSSDLFILKFQISNVADMSSIVFENINKKDIGIKLYDLNRASLITQCSLGDKDSTYFTFNINCNAPNYQKDTSYSLFISDNIKIGYNQAYQICQIDSTIYYRNLVIRPSEFDFFLIFNDENSYFDCNPKNYYLQNINNLCGACTSGCIECNHVGCSRCMDGYSKTSSGCEIMKDNINYDNFYNLEKYIPYNDNNCQTNENGIQLFSLKFSYIVLEGGIVAFKTDKTNNAIYARNTNNNRRYGLYCTVDVNPSYIQSDQYYGACKQTNCFLKAYANCSFHQGVNIENGVYDVTVDNPNFIGKLINKAKNDLNTMNIKYYPNKISAKIDSGNIQVLYEGYKSQYSSINFLLCQNSDTEINECYDLDFCDYKNYDINNDQTLYQCQKSYIDQEIKLGGKITNCLKFKDVRFENDCRNYLHSTSTIDYTYCNYDSNYSIINDINLLMLLFITLFLI